MKRETDSELVPSAEAARHGSSLRTGAFLARGGTLSMQRQLADACPRCLAVNRPHSVREDQGSLLALYRCRTCGRQWWRWWNPACLEVNEHGGASLDSTYVRGTPDC